MKKILLQFAALLLVICGIFLISGRTDGWIEPPEEEATGDIILSGTKYNGKVVVNITLHPDGTLEHEGNGTVTEGTWEYGEGDVAIVAHYPVKDSDYDINIYDTGSGYRAEYPLVADMELTGNKPVKSIVLSGTKYNGKVIINITLNPDGTGEHEGNGEKSPATWEKGEGDAAMVVHFSVKGTDYDMDVTDKGASYSAMYPLVADLELTGAKAGAAAAPAEAKEESAEQTAEPAAETEKQAAAETAAPAAEVKAEEAPAYPANAFVLPFTADINEQLKTTFYVEFDVWSKALGTGGSYTPTESKDVLFSWSGSGKSNELDFLADGTYEYRFTKMGITEHGTWSFDSGKLALISEAGKEQPAELNRAAVPEVTAKPAETKSEDAALPANTFTLEYVADINEQLTGSFSCPAERWKPALGDSGSYTPADSEKLLFSWDASGKSKKMDFFANGTYEFQFTTMSISERGKWTYEDGKLSVTTGAGKEYAAELTK